MFERQTLVTEGDLPTQSPLYTWKGVFSACQNTGSAKLLIQGETRLLSPGGPTKTGDQLY